MLAAFRKNVQHKIDDKTAIRQLLVYNSKYEEVFETDENDDSGQVPELRYRPLENTTIGCIEKVKSSKVSSNTAAGANNVDEPASQSKSNDGLVISLNQKSNDLKNKSQ